LHFETKKTINCEELIAKQYLPPHLFEKK